MMTKSSLPLLLLVGVALVGVVRVVQGEVLHGPGENDRKLKLYGPEDGTKDVKSYWEARNFCFDKGRVLATRHEWCDANLHKYNANDIYGGIHEDEQWAPIRGPQNDWVLIGKLDGSDQYGCKTYSEIYGVDVVDPNDITTTPAPAAPITNYCEKPEGCTGNKCEYTCTLDRGYYPDPTDCQAYCFCSGGASGTSSFWEKTDKDGDAWDPFCDGGPGGFSSKPLYAGNGPEAGMTGGCFHSEDYLNNKDHCQKEPTSSRRELYEEEEEQKRRRKLWKSYPLPRWGLHDWDNPSNNDKYHGEANYILCALLEEAPKMPEKCACVWGDPHINTYDGLKWDCQGQGDYILQRGLDTGLELQGRFHRVAADKQATVMKSITIKSGDKDAPTVEIDTYGNYLKYTADGDPVSLEHKFVTEGTYAFEKPNIHFLYKWPDRYFWYPQSGISLHYRFKRSRKLGTYLNVCLCLPDDVKEKNFVGMMGSPDGNMANDFMDRSGTDLKHGGDTAWESGYNQCTNNWCIDDNKENNFLEPGNPSDCSIPYDPSLENEIKNNAPQALIDVCGTDTACLIDGSVGSVDDSTDSVKEKETLKIYEPVITEVTVEETEDEVLNGDNDKDGKSASASGDPHLSTWAGVKYDFHGECDLVLLSNPDFAHGLGLDVHIRTKIDTWWSFIETAAVKIGENVLEITGGKERISYYLDGVKVEDMQNGDGSLGDFAVRFKRHSQIQSQTRIDLGNNNALSIETYKRFVRVNVKATHGDAFVGSYGMLGSFPTGDMVARDKVTVMNDITTFGQEWMVLETETSLFQVESEIKPPMKCRMPNVTSTASRRLGEATITEEDAALACSGVREEDRNACVFDVMATGDKGMAGTY